MHLVESLKVAAFPPRPDGAASGRRINLSGPYSIPKWVLIVAVTACIPAQFVYNVWLGQQLMSQLEAKANADTPSKTELRVSDRLAGLESAQREREKREDADREQARLDRAATKELQLAVVQQWKATTDLTWQLKALTEQVSALNSGSTRRP